MLRILLFGRNGQIGYELERILAPLGNVTALGREDVDLADAAALRAAIAGTRPQWIVNAAAYTAVDQAEREPELALAVNAGAPEVIAGEARNLGAILVHYSTDYVFDGRKAAPYVEEDEPAPLNVYGASKLAGERAVRAAGGSHFILRTSWVYGARGKNFLATILRLAREGKPLRIVDDQVGAPTWSRAIAQATARLLSQLAADPGRVGNLSGVYHLSAGSQTTWFGFAKAALSQAPWDWARAAAERLQAIPTSEFPTAAKRPLYSVLSNARLRRTLGLSLPSWETQLRDVIEEVVRAESGAAGSPKRGG